MRRRYWACVVSGMLVVAAGWWMSRGFQATTSGPMTQQAYVWQRQWHAEVQDAVVEHGPAFDRLVVLAGEIEFHQREPRVVRVAVSAEALRDADRPVGIALRIGPYGGPFSPADAVGRAIVELAREQVATLRAQGIEPAECQLDFDAATRHLAGYQVWIEAVRVAVDPVPVTITALPSWMHSPDFGPLVRATDGYVLQVHALDRPDHVDDPVALADPVKARRWVREAAAHGIPFSVALPTYGYLLAFDSSGRFAGLTAEGPMPDWPTGTQLRELAADPAAMADLVQEWTASRPMMMQGVIWYRLPTAGDDRNWRWPTLETVMAGRAPAAALTVEAAADNAGLVDVVLVNAGTADAELTQPVMVRWPVDARPIARDMLAGFGWRHVEPGQVMLSPPSETPARKLRPNERIAIAWMRFAGDTEVEAHVQAATEAVAEQP